ncbi:MAG: transcriptional regulator [Terriglobales bacterium]
MAKAQPGRQGNSEQRGRRRETVARPRAELAVPELDPMIHERIRLGIVSALAVNDRLSFNELKRLLNTTDGNLSVHARKLEEAGYLGCDKYFDGRVPKTEFWLTATGRKSLQRYLDRMEEIIRAARQG